MLHLIDYYVDFHWNEVVIINVYLLCVWSMDDNNIYKFEHGYPKVVFSVCRVIIFIYTWHKCNLGLLQWLFYYDVLILMI